MKGYYSIWGKYNGRWEKIDSANCQHTAFNLAYEYQVAFGRNWEIEIRHKGERTTI